MTVTTQEAAAALGLEHSGAVATDSRVPDASTPDRVDRLVKAASALVSSYAPDAPEAVQDEAVLQLVGYMHDAPESTAFTRNAFIQSGAGSLLSPYRMHDAGVIGGEAGMPSVDEMIEKA